MFNKVLTYLLTGLTDDSRRRWALYDVPYVIQLWDSMADTMDLDRTYLTVY